MKKYFSLILSFILISISFGYSQTNALMACHTGNFNQFGNDVISLPMVDCCDFYPEYNAGCSFGIGSCDTNIECLEFMSEYECNYEGGTYYSEPGCTNLATPSPTCTVENGVGKFKPVYKKKWFTAGEALASDIAWVPVCDPMPSAGGECSDVMDSCKRNNTTSSYLECGRYDTGEQTCTIDSCNTGYHQEGNECVPDAVNGVCSTDPNNMGCTAGNYMDLTDTSTEYKWQCSGQHGGQNDVCSRTIPIVPENGVCSSTHYGCNIGNLVSGSEVSGTIAWTWSCKGTNGGSTASCSETKPVTVTPIVPVGNWATSGAASSAIDDSIFAGMAPETLYTLRWCAAHHNEIGGGPCFDKKFTDVGGVATLPIDGGSDTLGNLVDGDNFAIEGEGVLTINTYAMDNAHNISKQKFVYKVDKTAPKFGDLVFTEIDGNQYINVEDYTGTIPSPGTLGVNHMSTQNDGSTFPTLGTYTKTSPSENVYTIDPAIVKQIRYKESGVPGTPTINVALDGATDTFGGTAHYNHVSRAQKIDFYKGNTVAGGASDYHESRSINLTQDVSGQKNLDLVTFDFSDSGTQPLTGNDGSFINVRLTDNAGNYSEKAFYVYRDETSPDMSKFVFKFTDDDDLILSSKNSKMIMANTSTAIKYDWGVDNDHMAPNIKIKTEKHDDASSFQEATMVSPTSGTSSPAFNLQDVDVTDINEVVPSGNYRNYATQFETPGITGNNICDIVGNCINGSLVLQNLRVMANNIDNDNSELTMYMPQYAHADNPSNTDADSYRILYTLRDMYGNRVRNVALGVDTIRKVFADIDFTNGLYAKQTGSSSDLGNPNAVLVTGTELSGSANSANNVRLEENISTSNGDFEFTVHSKVPTVGGYKYLKDTAILSLDSIENSVNHSNTSLIHNSSDYNNTVNFNGTEVVNIDSDIDEVKTNRYNLGDISGYGTILSGDFNTTLTNASLHKINLEFASPFIYHAENFNILRDGINSQHTKYMTGFTQMGTYSVLEKYFDANNPNSNTAANFYVNDTLQNVFKTIGSSLINNTYLAKYNALSGQSFSAWGYVSYIKYDAGDNVMIPSISRGVASNINNKLIKASGDFPNVTASGGLDFLTEDIAITGLVNKVDGLVNTSPRVGQASLDLERPYTRAELLEKLKKKIFTVNKIGNWCTGNITDLDLSDGGHSDCSFNINGEKIAFYEGDVTIDCGTTCNIPGRNALIVKDGRITIKSNINTQSTSGQILIASITDKGLENIEISNVTDLFDLSKQKGWMTIDENVTNIDAFLLAQGPLVSSNSSDDIIINYSNQDTLINQLHIYGSVFSLNTISGEKTNTCPYIEQNCNLNDTAKVYDLSFLRRYTLVDPVNFNGVGGGDNVPYDSTLDFTAPFSRTIARSSGWLQYYGNGLPVGPTTLRTAKSIHKNSPVIVERDHRWSTAPSYFAKD